MPSLCSWPTQNCFSICKMQNRLSENVNDIFVISELYYLWASNLGMWPVTSPKKKE